MIKPQPAFLRKAAKFLVQAVLVFVILIFVLVIYAELKIRWAERQIETFSQLVVIGMPVAGLEMNAKEMHLNFRRATDSTDNNGKFHVWEGLVFNRWFCDVEYQDGKAVKKKVTFVD